MEEIKTIGGYQLPRGADGGHYTPVVTQTAADTMTVEFQPSKAGMAAVEPVEIKLPVGSGDGSGQNADPAGTAASMVAAHNDSVEAHPDIRETLDELAEVAGVDVRPRPITVTLDTVGKNAGSLALDGSVASGSMYYSDLIATGGRRRFAIYNASSSITINMPLIFYAEDGSEVLRKTWRINPQSTAEVVVGFECAHIRINGTNGFVFGSSHTVTISDSSASPTENLYDPRTGLIDGLIDASTDPVGKHISAFLGGRHPTIWTILFPNRGAWDLHTGVQDRSIHPRVH